MWKTLYKPSPINCQKNCRHDDHIASLRESFGWNSFIPHHSKSFIYQRQETEETPHRGRLQSLKELDTIHFISIPWAPRYSLTPLSVVVDMHASTDDIRWPRDERALIRGTDEWIMDGWINHIHPYVGQFHKFVGESRRGLVVEEEFMSYATLLLLLSEPWSSRSVVCRAWSRRPCLRPSPLESLPAETRRHGVVRGGGDRRTL